MGLSRILLILAVSAAVVPLAANRFRPPSSIREIEKAFVVGVVTVGTGTVIVIQIHPLGLFGYLHLLYLLAVVSVPVLLGGWYVAAVFRRRRTRLLRLGGGLAVVIVLLGVWGTHIEPNWLAVDLVAVSAPVQQPIRIGVLSDLQTPNVGKHEWNAVNALIDAQPDLVLVPGDFFQGDPGEIEAELPAFVELLSALVDAVGVVAVVSGDSDRPAELILMVEAAGALYADNLVSDLAVNGQQIRLAGVTVLPATGRLDTLAELSQPTDALTILLSHRPDVVFELPLGSDVNLIVSGHTHGGQLSFPFIGPPVVFSDIPRDLAAGGIGLVENYPVYVSTGVGLERLEAPQVRFGVRPSIGIIDVVPRSVG